MDEAGACEGGIVGLGELEIDGLGLRQPPHGVVEALALQRKLAEAEHHIRDLEGCIGDASLEVGEGAVECFLGLIELAQSESDFAEFVRRYCGLNAVKREVGPREHRPYARQWLNRLIQVAKRCERSAMRDE